MALTVIQPQRQSETASGAVGSGISQLLQALAQQKLQSMAQSQSAPGLEGLGFSPEQAQSIAQLNPMVQKEVVKQRMLAPQQEAYAQALSGLLGGEAQTQQQLGGLQGAEEATLPQIASPETRMSPQMPSGLTGQQATQLAQLGLKKQAMEQREKLAGQKISEQREMAYKKDIDEALKTRSKLENQTRSLGNIIKYSKSDKLTGPLLSKTLKKIGFDWMLSPESQAFESEVKSFYDSFKEMFGAKPIGLEFEAFKNMLPSLMQSKAGRGLVFENLDAYLSGKRARSDAVIDAFKQNKNLSPVDMALRIEDLAQEKLKSLKKKDLNLIEDFAKEDQPVDSQGIKEAEGISQEEKPSFMSKLQGIAGSAIAAPFKLAELPLHGMEYLSSKGIIPPPTDPENLYNAPKIKEAIGGAKPENILEKTLDYTAGNWPLLFLGSGSLGLKTGADLAGSLGLATAEKLTDNPWIQLGASVLGSAGFGKLASVLKKNPSKVGNYINNLYEKEQKVGSAIKANPDALRKPLEDLYADVEKKFTSPQFSTAAKQRMLENIKVADDLVKKQGLKASDVFDIKKNLNQLWAPKKSLENVFNRRLQKIFFNELEDLGKSNKNWAQTWKQADNLYKIQNWQTGLQRWLKSQGGIPGKVLQNPIAQGAAAILGGAIPHTRALAAAGAGGLALAKGGEKLTKAFKFLNELGKTDAGKKLLWEITTASAKDASTQIASALNKLNKEATKYSSTRSASTQ